MRLGVSIERQRNRIFDETQQSAVDILNVTEIQDQIGEDRSRRLIDTIEAAVPIGIKNNRTHIPRVYRDSVGPFVLMLLNNEAGNMIIDPVTNVDRNRLGSQNGSNPAVDLSVYTYQEGIGVNHGALLNVYDAVPSSTLIGDWVRMSPIVKGPIVISSEGRQSNKAVTLAHEVDHFDFIEQGIYTTPVSVLKELTAMELRAHSINYATYNFWGSIKEVNIADFQQMYSNGSAAQQIGEAIFSRLRETYGPRSFQFSSHFAHIVRIISGNIDLDPVHFEKMAMVTAGLVPNATYTR
jgi:hypothetical protein